MARHPIDVFSLVAGLLFVALAGGYIAREYSGLDLDPRLVLPVTLIVLGVGGLAAAVLGQRRARRSPAGSTEQGTDGADVTP